MPQAKRLWSCIHPKFSFLIDTKIFKYLRAATAASLPIPNNNHHALHAFPTLLWLPATGQSKDLLKLSNSIPVLLGLLGHGVANGS